MAECINYHAQHPIHKNRMDAAIRTRLLKGFRCDWKDISDSDRAGWKFKVMVVRVHQKGKGRFETVAYVRFNDQQEAVLEVTHNVRQGKGVQGWLYR